MSKATITFPISTQGVPITGIVPSTSFDISVVRYTRGYQNQVVQATTRNQKNGYPLRIKEQDIQLTIQCRSLDQFMAIKSAIGRTQARSVQVLSPLNYIRFSWPRLDIDILGFIPQAPEGVRRFDFAPQLSFSIALFQDTINTIAQQYSTVNGTWQDIVGTDYTKIAPPVDPTDTTLGRYIPGAIGDHGSKGGGR